MEWIALAIWLGICFFPEQLGEQVGRFVGAVCNHIKIRVVHTHIYNQGNKS